MKLRFDPLLRILIIATALSVLLNRDFFFGMLLFAINYSAFKVIVRTMFGLPTDNIGNVKRFYFIPAVLLKFGAIGAISYLVLVKFHGSALWYVGGFAIGLLIFTIGVVKGGIKKANTEDLN